MTEGGPIDAVSQIEVVLEAMTRHDVDVRREHLGCSGGNLCKLRGQWTFFLDLDADLETRLDSCLTALAALPGAELAYLPPEIRERIDCLRSGPS